MNIQALVPLIATVAYVPLLVILVLNRPWHKQHRLLAAFVVSTMLWSATTFLLRSGFLAQHTLLLFNIVMSFGLWLTVQFYWLLMFLCGQRGGFWLWFAYASLLVFLTASALGYFPRGISFAEGVVTPDLGPWFFLFIIPTVMITIVLFYFTIRRVMTPATPEEHNLAAYSFLSAATLSFLGFAGLLIPIGRDFPISHLGNLLVACILTYVALRHRLLYIGFVLRRGLAWSGVAAVGIAGYLALFLLIHLLFGREVNTITLVLTIPAAAAAAILVYQIRRLFFTWIDRLFNKETYDSRQKALDFVGRRLSGVYSLGELGERLLPLLVGSLGCQRAFLLLPERGSGDFVAEFVEPRGQADLPLRMTEDSPVLEWLKRENRRLSRDNLDTRPEFRGLWSQERAELEALDIELLFPIISRGGLIGILGLSGKKSGKYLLGDIGFVETIMNRAAASLEKEYLQDQLRKREEELSLINKLSGVITSSLNIRDVYDSFVERLKEAVNVEMAIIVTVEGSDVCFEALHGDVNSAWHAGLRIPIEGSAVEWLLTHKKSLIEPDLTQSSKFKTGKVYVKQGFRSIVYLPLLIKGEVFGSLIIGSRQPDDYNPEQVHLLEQLASQIAMPVENSRLYAKAEQRARIDELTGLFNRRHFDESLKQEIDRHSRYNGNLSLIFLDLDSFKDYNDREGHIAGDKILTRIGWLIQNSVRNTDFAFRYGGDEFAVLAPRSSADDVFVVAERIRGRIVAEMRSKGSGITASIGLASWPGDGVTEAEIVNAADSALYYAKRTGGDRTSVASKMLPSVTEAAEPSAHGEREALSTIYALAATIEARDKYTYGHSRKVSRYAAALAEAINLPSEKVAVISTAALLHDIGKIGIADEVLNKPSQLDSEEMELIKSHPRWSATIVGHVPSLTPCLPAVLHHQERWDGTGYPSGLKGKSIPLEARILAVADAFDAMTSPRPYRDPLPYKEVLKELRRGAGSQFDPELIEAFLPIALATIPEEFAVGESLEASKVD